MEISDEPNNSEPGTSPAPPHTPSTVPCAPPGVSWEDLLPDPTDEIIEAFNAFSFNEGLFENKFFETRTSPLGGYGSFAKRDLRRGDVILQESPLMIARFDGF